MNYLAEYGFIQWACQSLLWINVIYYGSALVITNLICKPYQRTWDKTIPGTCIKRTDLDVSSSILNLVSHLLVLILPHSVIWKLNMKWRTKLGISLVFAIGLL